MSKEQTPITAEELYISIADVLGRHWKVDVENTEKCVQIAEQYAQYRERKAVLEALEREFNHKDCININKSFFNSDGELDILSASEYYKTEVKPKYKL